MIFDKNEKRLRELRKRDPVKHAERIAELEKRGPEWWVRYWDKCGASHDEKCPQEYQGSKRLAQRYYNRVTTCSDDGTHAASAKRRTTVSEMCAFFLVERGRRVERSGKRGGYDAARSLCRAISADIGMRTFDECRHDPRVLQGYVDGLGVLHPGWSSKTRWNLVKELKAVFSTWLRKNLLNLPNPMNAIDEPEPGTNVMDYVPTHEDYERIIATGMVEGVRPDVLRLIGAVRYSGLRIREVLSMKCCDVVLDPADGYPYVWVEISKQRRKTRVPIPIRRELAEILREQVSVERPDDWVWPWRNPPYRQLIVWEWAGHNARNGWPERLACRGSLYELAGVNVPRPFHDFRKTVKMELTRSNLSDKARRAMQGHRTEAADDWYTWFQRDDLEAAVSDSYRDQTGTKEKRGAP